MVNVVVNGTFDILHVGHLRMLKYAKDIKNSYVLVLIDSDERVKELKGKDRPINNQEERKELLESLKFVDEVKIFNTADELINFIKDFNTDVMVKGSDYKGKSIIGSEHCKEIRFYDYVDGYSTTNKIQNIVNRR